jgi:hypothetical protein
MAKRNPVNGQPSVPISQPLGSNADGLPIDLVQVLQAPVNAHELIGIQQARIVQLERALNIALRELQRLRSEAVAHSAPPIGQS